MSCFFLQPLPRLLYQTCFLSSTGKPQKSEQVVSTFCCRFAFTVLVSRILHFLPVASRRSGVLSRKEVIQPQLPLQLPCYDFVPVTSPALDDCSLAVRSSASGVTSSHDVTGGVYKARERIHRAVADARLLAIPTSWSRVADSNLN